MPCLSRVHGFIHPSGTLSTSQKDNITKLEQKFELNDIQLQSIISKMHLEMDRGLSNESGCLLMAPSYVTGRPEGVETGEYLALDFGGTNCRICLIKLKGKGEVEVINDKFKFSGDQLKEDGVQLFATLSEFIGNFVKNQKINATADNPMKLGFTFSFPVNQTSITKGTLVRWTKGFENSGVVGEDITEKLQTALNKRQIHVQVNALVNDTVGTLTTSSYIEPSSQLGVILGTGTNAAYYELTKNIPKLPEAIRNQSEEMAINMEWGAFDDDRTVLPLTEYDLAMDELTPNPSEQTFEKTVSGFYLGELFRLIINDFHNKNLVFSCKLPTYFGEFGGVKTEFLSKILKDSSTDLNEIKGLFDFPSTLGDRIIIQKVAELVGRRAAQLAGAASAAVLLKRSDLLDKPITVGVDGSVYKFFPYFQLWMDETVSTLVGSTRAHNIQFAIARDGSGIGAALISMISQMKQ